MDQRYLPQQQQLLAEGITALDADESNVFLGTASGALLRYVVFREDVDSESDSFTYLLASQQEASEAAPVKAILLLANVQLVAVLANDLLSFYSLPEFAPASHLRTVKDVQGVIIGSQLATENEGEVCASLTVFTKRKVRQLLITPDRIKLAREVEYLGCVAACQRGAIVCAATKHAYDLLDLDQKARIQLFPTVQGEANPEGPQFDKFVPHIVSPSPNEFLVTSGSPEMSNALGMFITLEGDITRGTLMFDDYPLSLVCDDEQVLALMPSQQIEVHNIVTQVKEHTISVPGMTAILNSSCAVDIVIKENLDLITLVGFQKDDEKASSSLDVARRVSVVPARTLLFGTSCVTTLGFATQLMQFDSMLQLGNLESVLKDAKTFYKARPSEESFHSQAFLQQKAGLLYLEQLLFDDAMDCLLAGHLDPRVLLTLFSKVPSNSENMKRLQLYKGVRDRLELMQPIESVIRTTLEATVDDAATLAELCAILEGQATDMLRNCLTKYRKKRQESLLVDDVLGAVEGALLHILLSMDRGESKVKLQEFFQLELTDIPQATHLLEQHGRWWELLQLNSRLARHEEALTIWRRLMEGEITDTDYPGDGFRAMKAYLLRHGTDNLIWRFGVWLLEMYTDAGIELFDQVNSRQESRITYKDLLDHLRVSEDRSVFLKVLNHVVATSAHVDEALTNELVLSFAEQVTGKLQLETLCASAAQAVSNYRQLPVPKISFPMFVLDNQYAGSGELRQFGELRAKLIDRLQGDSTYDAQAVLEVIMEEGDILLAERTILYGRLGKHAEAFKILVHDLQDFESAELYSYHGGVSLSSLSIGSHKQQIVAMRYVLFPLLLRECLSLSDTGLKSAQGVALLDRWANYMVIEDVLALVPDEWSLEKIAKVLKVLMAHLSAEKREAQIQRSLMRQLMRRTAERKHICLDR